MSPSPLITVLQELYRDKQALYDRHVAGARFVTDYDFNNTYQYVINREEQHLSWLRHAIEDGGADAPGEGASPQVPGGKGDARQRAIIEEDRRAMQAFHDKWAPRLDEIRNERHRRMVGVILGEALEQRRFFEQMLQGREDVLGRRTAGPRTGGEVLPVRWVE